YAGPPCRRKPDPSREATIRNRRGRAAGLVVASNVDVGAQRVVLDEFAPRLDHVAPQLGEDVVGLVDLLDLHLQQRTRLGVERGLPELPGVHLAEAFIALQLLDA